MQNYVRHILFLTCTLCCLLVPADVAAISLEDFFNSFFNGSGGNSGACSYNGDVRSSFKNCNPSEWLRSDAGIDLDVQAKSDFRDVLAIITRRIQIVASILAIGALVFVGFLLVAPVKEETKSKSKKGFLYATVGFLLTIVASIIVNAIVDFIYDIFW